ncbi:alpha/beta hydrolase [Candidatus Nitrospira bockiana]
MEHAVTFYDAEGHRIAGLLSTPAVSTDRVAVLCHGFLSSKQSTTNKTLTRLLNERGIATFRFDFFGQGESQGPFEDITVSVALGQASAALDLVREKGYRRVALMGSSFGGLVAILTAAQRRDLAALALKCPVPDFPETLRLEFGVAGMQHWKESHEVPDVTGGPGLVRLKYRLYEDALTYDAYKAAESIQAPVLIVQGDCDELVPLHQSCRVFEAVRTEKHLEIIPGADHGFTKGDDFRRMTTLIAEWFVKHLG